MGSKTEGKSNETDCDNMEVVTKLVESFERSMDKMISQMNANFEKQNHFFSNEKQAGLSAG